MIITLRPYTAIENKPSETGDVAFTWRCTGCEKTSGEFPRYLAALTDPERTKHTCPPETAGASS